MLQVTVLLALLTLSRAYQLDGGIQNGANGPEAYASITSDDGCRSAGIYQTMDGNTEFRVNVDFD